MIQFCCTPQVKQASDLRLRLCSGYQKWSRQTRADNHGHGQDELTGLMEGMEKRRWEVVQQDVLL